MPTAFSLLCQVCGLSHREAADFLGVRLDTVKSWSSGRNPTPAGALDDLVELAARIDMAADQAVDVMADMTDRHGEPEAVEIGVASDDAEARLLGWPCVGAHRAVVALAVARGMAEGLVVDIVPRGTTPATAMAADLTDKS